MLRVKLKKIKSDHANLRTNEIDGKTTHIPEVGHQFQIFAPPLDGGDFRVITTTKVVESEYKDADRSFIFKTANSVYELKVTDERDPMEYKRYERPTKE